MREKPIYDIPDGLINPPLSAKWASLLSSSSFRTPISLRILIAGVQTASPQYLSLGKLALSSSATCLESQSKASEQICDVAGIWHSFVSLER